MPLSLHALAWNDNSISGRPLPRQSKRCAISAGNINPSKTNCTQIKNQLHALNASFKPHRESFKRKTLHLKFLQRQIVLIQKELRALVKTEPHLALRLKNIKTAKGLGDMTILTVLSETRCFELVSNLKTTCQLCWL